MSSVLDLLRQSILFYKKHAALLAGYVAWLLLPYAGLVLIQFVPDELIGGVGSLLFILIELVLYIWMSILLVFATHDLLIGKPPDTHAWNTQVRALMLPVVLVNLLQLVVIMGGLILLIIPGLIFAVWFFFAPMAAMLDGKRGMEALSYSRQLVQGRFWRVAWVQSAGPVLFYLVYYTILALVVAVIASLLNAPADLLVSENPPLWLEVLVTTTDVFVLPVTIIYTTLLYLELKKTAAPIPTPQE